MGKFEVEKDNIGELIILPREQAVLMTYYRNNIQHMLVLPSLIANMVMNHNRISRTELPVSYTHLGRYRYRKRNCAYRSRMWP